MLLTTIGLISTIGFTGFQPAAFTAKHAATSAIAYPWAFTAGTGTSRRTAWQTVNELEQKAGYSAIPAKDAAMAWQRMGNSTHRPTAHQLKAFGKKEGAAYIFYGSVSWHTRSIWVGAGPKTISTATANAYVFNVASGKTVYSKRGVTGRSDERDTDLKLVADVLLTPLVSAVSGGPATPREQRAAQIALSRAYHSYIVRTH